MDIEEFISSRNKEKEWARMNGFNEGDPNKNGEFALVKILSEFSDVFIDIGSNNGIFIDEWNKHEKNEKSNIFVFEPNPYLQEILHKKIVRGKVFQIALSSKKGISDFNLYDSDNTTSSLLDRDDMMPHFTANVRKIKIETDLLDNYLKLIESNLDRALFIKIDVEGLELEVIKGSAQVLSHLPNIFLMFEYSKAWHIGNYSLKETFHILDKLNFKIFRITPLGIEELRFYSPEMDGPDYCNYFAVKGENPLQNNTQKLLPSITHNFNKLYLFS